MTDIKREIERIHEMLSILSLIDTVRVLENRIKTKVTTLSNGIFTEMLYIRSQNNPLTKDMLKILSKYFIKILTMFCRICTKNHPLSPHRQKIVDASIDRYTEILLTKSTNKNEFALSMEDLDELEGVRHEIFRLRICLFYPPKE